MRVLSRTDEVTWLVKKPHSTTSSLRHVLSNRKHRQITTLLCSRHHMSVYSLTNSCKWKQWEHCVWRTKTGTHLWKEKGIPLIYDVTFYPITLNRKRRTTNLLLPQELPSQNSGTFGIDDYLSLVNVPVWGTSFDLELESSLMGSPQVDKSFY